MGMIAILVGILQLGCGDIFGDINNLFDPTSDGYAPPETEIVLGPGQNTMLDSANVVFAWRHADENYWPDTAVVYDYPGQILYSYKLDNASWSDWLSGAMVQEYLPPNHTYDDSIGWHYLQFYRLEDGEHRFEIRSKYPSDIEETGWPQRDFSIDAIDGTALIASPAYTLLDSGSTFILTVKMIDVVDLMGVNLVLDYQPDNFAVVEYSLKTDSTGFLALSGGQVLEFLEIDPDQGRFTASIAVSGGSVTGINGSGILARIRFAHTGAAGQYEIVVSDESVMRNVYNDDILDVRQNCQVIVW